MADHVRRTLCASGRRSLSEGYLLEREQWVPAPLADVFPFFEDPANLARITPPWLRFQVRDSTHSSVQEGTRIRYRIRWLGLSMPWESVISVFRPPHEFVDEMLVGPYRSWHHTHRFEPHGDRVRMTDQVRYTLPAGAVGRFAHRLLVRRQLEAIFDYRESAVRQLFGDSPRDSRGSVT